MSSIYRRRALAAQMAKQLLHPGVLDEGLRSGLFLSGLRRVNAGQEPPPFDGEVVVLILG